MKSKSLVKLSAKAPVKVKVLTRFATLPKALKTRLAFPKAFKAAVVTNPQGSPKYFVFDTGSLWDFLCAADEALEEHTAAEAYAFHNPVGWLIDAIECHLPLNPALVAKLKRGLDETSKHGIVPFERVKKDLGLP